MTHPKSSVQCSGRQECTFRKCDMCAVTRAKRAFDSSAYYLKNGVWVAYARSFAVIEMKGQVFLFCFLCMYIK